MTTTGFGNRSNFINELRASYCAAQGTPGVHAFLRASSASVHGQLNNDNWEDGIAGGTMLRDWLDGAMANPGGVTDKVDEGTLVADIAGCCRFRARCREAD